MPEQADKDTYYGVLDLIAELAFLSPNDGDYIDKNKQKSAKISDIFSSIPSERKFLGAYLLLNKNNEFTDTSDLANLPSPNKEICKYFNNKKEIEETFFFYHESLLHKVYQKILSKAIEYEEPSKAKYSHTQRRHTLNTLINSLQKQLTDINSCIAKHLEEPASESPDIDWNKLLYDQKLTLSEAYYHRGRIVRARGFTVPPKKVELYKQSKNLLEELIENTKNDDNYLDLQAKAEVRKALLYLQMKLHGMEIDDYEEFLRTFISKYPDRPETIDFILALGEAGSLEEEQEKQLRQTINNGQTLPPIARARAYRLLRDWRAASEELEKSIEQLEGVSFYHESWNQIVALLKDDEFRKKETALWAPLCIQLWERVTSEEQKIFHGCHLRWYWSSQRDVYDLAFHAADKQDTDNNEKYFQQAQIADSLKGRPTLHQLQLEGLDAENYIETQDYGRLEQYQPNFCQHGQSNENQPGFSVEWSDLPKPWIAIHFYLGNGVIPGKYGVTTGYALVNDSESQTWKRFEFNYKDLWSAYTAWQDSYAKVPKSDDESRAKAYAGIALEKLCKTIGDQMDFLIDLEKLPTNRPILFIPHDFLQRVPLHAAMNTKGGIRAAFNPCLFLPAYWYMGSNSHDLAVKKGKTLIYDSKDSRIQKDAEKIHNKESTKLLADEKGKNTLLHKNQTGKLLVYCHGEAHPLNPYLSKLKLGREGTTLKEILKSDRNYSGTTIGLIACETDLTSLLPSPLDEHVSIAATFLSKNADYVLGSFWRVDNDTAIQLIADSWFNSDEEETLLDSLMIWLNKNTSTFRAESDKLQRGKILFDIIAFRLLGCPQEINKPEE